MNNPAVQQALIELEESLSKIESARTQVNNVAEKSELLIRSFTKALDAINSINKNISFDKELVNSQINDSLKVFQSGLSKIVKESESKVKDLENTLGAKDAKFEQSITKSFNNTDGKLNQLVSDIKSNSDGFNKRMESELNGLFETIKNANNQINSFVNTVASFEKKIQEIDFTLELKQIEDRINSNHKQTLIIGIIIILGLIAIAIFK